MKKAAVKKTPADEQYINIEASRVIAVYFEFLTDYNDSLVFNPLVIMFYQKFTSTIQTSRE